MKYLIAAICTSVALACFVILGGFYCLNKSTFYNAEDNFRDTIGVEIPASDIQKFAVRNFFYIDGPDFYYQLSLSPERAKILANAFNSKSDGSITAQHAFDMIPASWQTNHDTLKHYNFVSNGAFVSECFMDIDEKNNKAWIVILKS